MVFVADEGFDFFDVRGSESGVGELYDLCEAFFIGAYAEDGFLDAESFKKLGSHESVSVVVGGGVGEYKDDGALMVEIERLGLWDIAGDVCRDVVLLRELLQESLSVRVGVNDELVGYVGELCECLEEEVGVVQRFAEELAAVGYGKG